MFKDILFPLESPYGLSYFPKISLSSQLQQPHRKLERSSSPSPLSSETLSALPSPSTLYATAPLLSHRDQSDNNTYRRVTAPRSTSHRAQLISHQPRSHTPTSLPRHGFLRILPLRSRQEHDLHDHEEAHHGKGRQDRPLCRRRLPRAGPPFPRKFFKLPLWVSLCA